MLVTLHPITTKEEIQKLMAMEGRPEYRNFIRQWSLEEHLKCLSDPDYAYFLIFNSEEHVGYVFVRGLQTNPQKLEIKRIAIYPADKGYGKQAFRELLAWCFEKQKAEVAWLDHFCDNHRAHALYSKLGFSEVRRQPVVNPDGTPGELVIMEIYASNSFIVSE